MEILTVLEKISGKKLNLSHSVLLPMKAGVYLKYFVIDCLWKQFPVSNMPHIPSNLICLTNFCHSYAFDKILT